MVTTEALHTDLFATAYEKGILSTLRLMKSKGVDSNGAEELAQAAWARAWSSRAQLRDQTCLQAWVNSIAFNLLRSEYRRRNRYTELPELLVDLKPSPATAGAKRDVTAALGQCSPLDRKLLTERFMEEKDNNEIGRAHGMTALAVRVRVHRARKHLQEFLNIGAKSLLGDSGLAMQQRAA